MEVVRTMNGQTSSRRAPFPRASGRLKTAPVPLGGMIPLSRRRLACVVLVLLALPALAALPSTGATHEGAYEEAVLVEQETARVDVFVVPPERGPTAQALAAFEEGFAAVDAGLARYGAPWLAQGLVVSVYVLGRDVPPEGTLPEIVVVPEESGSSVAFAGSPCVALVSLPLAWDAGSHRVVRFRLMHEYVHCLGAGHPAEDEPVGDLMNGRYVPPAGVEPCLSNLNVRAVEGSFARVLGQPSTAWGATALVPVGDYDRTC